MQVETLPEASFAFRRAVFKHMNWFLTVYIAVALVNCVCTLARPYLRSFCCTPPACTLCSEALSLVPEPDE